MYTDTGTTELTEGQCMKYGIHYGYDTHALSVGTANAIMRDGGDSWFFITADYAFGHSLKDNAIKVVTQQGGNVLGSVNVPDRKSVVQGKSVSVRGDAMRSRNIKKNKTISNT